MPQAGALELIIGPMFSGKSTELLRRVRRHAFARRSTIVVKYSVSGIRGAAGLAFKVGPCRYECAAPLSISTCLVRAPEGHSLHDRRLRGDT